MEIKKNNRNKNKISLNINSFFLLSASCFINVSRRLVIFALLFFLAVNVFAQLTREQSQMRNSPWWLTLEQGKLKFRAGDYGAALLQFEDARRQRRASYEQMERDLIHLLSLRDVRRLGDILDRVERYSKDMHYTAASAALEELYYRVPKASLNNSANRALEALGKLKDYPEAEYWIGEIYRVEGEYRLALTQYNRALELSDLAEDPGFSPSLRYKIGNIQLVLQNYNEMERTYLSIIDEFDTLWRNAREAADNPRTRIPYPGGSPVTVYEQASASFTTSSMTRILENEGIGRFLELYRYNNTQVEAAHRQLGFFYAATGRPSAQQHLMYAFLIQNTIIIQEITRRKFDFTLTDPNPPRRPQPSARELLLIGEEINKNQTLIAYAEEIEYYKTAYYLGLSLYRNNRNNSRQIANIIWGFLAEQPNAGEWRSRSLQQLQNPRLEPVVERP